MQRDKTSTPRPRVVIVGAGFGGLTAAKALGKAPVDLTVIDRRNYHLFQPLLYQVATAGLSPAEIASPIRQILGSQLNTTVLLGAVSGVDAANKDVIVDGHRIPFDRLLIATGAGHAYFGHDEWEKYAPGLKSVDDATYLRGRILLAFEKAENETDDEERRRLMSFVIVGAGPTGVEMAGAIVELARNTLVRNFRRIDPSTARVVLIEAGPRLLPAFAPSLAAAAARELEAFGVEVMLGHAVTGVDADGVIVGGERVEARTIVWAAGVMASPAGKWLGAPTDRAKRVIVGADLTVPGRADIFVIGDAASAPGADGKPLPGVAPVAKQQGAYVARRIQAEIEGKASPPFRYRDYGSLATVGRKFAVVQIGRLKLAGFFAWLIWCVAHVFYLIGFRNRLAVMLDWAWSYITFQRGTRLITGSALKPAAGTAPSADRGEARAPPERMRGAA